MKVEGVSETQFDAMMEMKVVQRCLGMASQSGEEMRERIVVCAEEMFARVDDAGVGGETDGVSMGRVRRRRKGGGDESGCGGVDEDEGEEDDVGNGG